MITLPTCEFSFVASAGALGWAGEDEGHGFAALWKKPFRLMGKLRTEDFAFFTKTLTLEPVAGHLTLLRPWRAVRLLGKGSVVNSVGMTNPGLGAWIEQYAWLCRAKPRQKTFVSIQADSRSQAMIMAADLEVCCRGFLKGIELDVSCPNVGGTPLTPDDVAALVAGATEGTSLPVGIKVGFQQNFLGAAERVAGKISWVHAINAVPWELARAGELSPLLRYGYKGAVSGREIAWHSRHALAALCREKLGIPIISGGGIMSAEEAKYRFDGGAGAVAFGSLFLLKPWAPNAIARKLSNDHSPVAGTR